MPPATPPHKSGADEEPELTQEESVPTDGKDVEGERMIKDVRNDKLHDKSGTEAPRTGG